MRKGRVGGAGTERQKRERRNISVLYKLLGGTRSSSSHSGEKIVTFQDSEWRERGKDG